MTTLTLNEKMIYWQLRKVKEDSNLIGRSRYLYEKLVELTGWGKHGCIATNRYFSEVYKVHKDTVSRWLTSLEKEGYIQRETIRDPQTKEIIERKIYLAKPKDMTKEYIESNPSVPSLYPSTSIGIGENVRENIKQENTIKQEEETNEIFSTFKEVNQTISDKEKHVLTIFEKQFGKEFVLYAINKSSHADCKIAYIRTLLNDWKNKGIKTTSELEPKFNILNKVKKSSKRSKGHKHTLSDGKVVQMKDKAKRVEMIPNWLKASNDSWNNVFSNKKATSTDSQMSENRNDLSESSIRSMISSNINFNMPILDAHKEAVENYIKQNPNVINELKL